MNDTTNLIAESAEKMFSDLVNKAVLDKAEEGVFADEIWRAICANGFDQLGVTGSGTGLADLFHVLVVAGKHALPLPLAEACLVNRWLGSNEVFGSIGCVEASQIVDVPWGRQASVIIGIAPEGLVRNKGKNARAGVNLAGEARDSVELDAQESVACIDDPFALLTLSRVCLMAGAMQTVLDLTLRFAQEREQFGRPISKFQVIQHQLAVIAAEFAASLKAADAAVEALGTDRFITDLAIAKARIGEAVGVVNELAHQIHGAMGYTHEHQLHHFTRRLWAWREEYGDEIYWQTRLGAIVVEQGGDGAWDYLATSR
ncbi:MAG: acyl-CoA dehydrogenase family protein [Proteobacteria bacterium]|nr:acyl-CoA dehydrogenase family protein [Pseudomonadota bacterium]